MAPMVKPMPRTIISGAAAIMLLLMGESLPGVAAQEQLEPEPPAAFATIISVDVSRRTIKLSHEPIPDINWPPMLMEFEANPTVDLSQLRPGTRDRRNYAYPGRETRTLNGAQSETSPTRWLVVEFARLAVRVAQGARAETIRNRCDVSRLDFQGLLPKPELALTGRTGDDQ